MDKKEKLEDQQLSIALSALEASDATKKTLDAAKLSVASNALSQGLTIEQANVAIDNAALNKALSVHTAHSTQKPDNYGRMIEDSEGKETIGNQNQDS